MPIAVLFVCTGNICRSPTAERLILARTQRGSNTLLTASGGTRALVGHPMDAASAEVLHSLGGDANGHVARQLSTELVHHADLILTAATAHRASIVQADPSRLHRTFTLREFARLGADLPPPPNADDEGRRQRIAEVAARRGAVPAAEPGSDDISDPFRAPAAVMLRCSHEVSDAVDAVIDILGLPR